MKRDVTLHSTSLLSRNRRRFAIGIAAAVAAALIVLSVYLLHRFGPAVAPYASRGSDSPSLKASASSGSCVKPTVVPMTSRDAQSGVARGRYYITNDSWNAHNYSVSQAIYVCNYNSWYAIAKMNNNSGDGAVKTSPNVQETWYPTPTRISSWESIDSQFSDLPPGSGPNYGTWEFEYDVWLNGLADSKSTEIMIWTYNNGQQPAGSYSGSFRDAGQTYEVFRRPGPYQYVAFVDRNYRLSGQLDLLSFFNYVISRGWMPSSSSLYQICNGVELVSTNNKPEKFAVNDFSINMKLRA